MSTMEALIILFIGIVTGWQLPALFAHLHRFYRRKTFKPVLLRPYVARDTTGRSK